MKKISSPLHLWLSAFPSKNKIIITGGAGFVGTNLIKLFLKKTKLKIISIDDYSSGRASIWSAVINNWSEIGLFPVDPIAAYENFGGMHSISLDLILGFGIFGFLISVWFYGGILLFRRKFNTLGILLIYGASNLTLTGWYLIEPVFWLTCGILIYETKEKITRSRYQSIS